MDLKALILAKRKATAEEFQGRKYVKRSDLEAARLQKLRDEEEEERQQGKAHALRAPVQLERRRKSSGEVAADEELSRDEVIRRLRALQQPVTLFGEDDAARLARLKSASASLAVEDDVLKAGTENENLRMARAEKAEKSTRARAAAAEAAAAEAERKTNMLAGTPPGKEQGGTPTEAAEDGGGADLMAAFKAAAAAVAERQAEAAMATEDRIMKHLTRWCDAWRDDLERRPAEIKESGPGQQAMMLYKSTMEYFKPMMRSLRKKDIPADLLAGIWIIVQDIKDRNYLHANNTYMSLAVGNQAWPIGVTSIGIHERSSREKISHVMNTGGAAHIMNDEATRKYLQAMKRLLTVMQRLYPTDPSRCMDFDGYKSAERGAAGGGSDKLALLDAEARGDTWRDHGLSQAPHFLHEDGTVKVPQAWADKLKQVYKENPDIIKPGSGNSSPARRPSTPGVSPAQKPPLSRQAKVS